MAEEQQQQPPEELLKKDREHDRRITRLEMRLENATDALNVQIAAALTSMRRDTNRAANALEEMNEQLPDLITAIKAIGSEQAQAIIDKVVHDLQEGRNALTHMQDEINTLKR